MFSAWFRNTAPGTRALPYATGYDKGKCDAVKQQYGLPSSRGASATRSAASANTPCNCPVSGLTE